MPLLICGILSVALLIATVVVAVLLRKDLRKSVRALSVGFFATIFVALAPCHVTQSGSYSFGVNLFDTICVMITQSSLSDSLASLTQYNSSIREAYRIYLICLYILGPISVASATLSFVKGFGRVVYAVKSLVFESYIFSSANERSLAVCKSIRTRHPKAVVLFALGDDDVDVDERVLAQIDEFGGIVVRRGVKDVKHTLRRKRHYCLLDTDVSSNIELGLALNNKYKDNKKALENVELTVYSSDEMSQIVFYNTVHNVTIHLFREEEIIANDLLFNYPLYGGVEDGKLNVLIVGGGKIGYEILKKVIWSGYLGNKVNTQITVVDLKATDVESRLKKDCPALTEIKNLNLHFSDADVNGCDFAATLDSMDKPTYIVVALGDEKVNADTCIYLRRHFGLTDGFPKIHMTTDSKDFVVNLNKLSACEWDVTDNRYLSKRLGTEQNFEIKGFGSYESAYEYIYPAESDFGLLALACHVVKLGTSDDNGGYRRERETIRQFVNTLCYSYNQIFFFKNNADQLALSIGYLLYILDYPAKCKDYLEQVQNKLHLSSIYDVPFALYVDSSYDFAGELQKHIDEMADVTTERYNRFMYTIGWTNLPIDEIKNKCTRDPLRLKYARIGNYDVKALEQLMNDGKDKPKNYRKNDIDEILRLPIILQLYEEMKNGTDKQ